MLPAIEIVPAGAGTATQQQAFTWNGAGDNVVHSFSSASESYLLFLTSSSTYQIDAYRLTAQAASGYTFRRFEITYDNDEDGSPVAGGNVYTSGYLDTVKAEKEREGHPGTVFTRLIGDYSETSGSYSYSYHVTGIKAVFDQGTPPATTYTISAYSSPQNGGTVQVGNAESGATSSQTVEVGGSVNIVAIAASGYAFNGWYLGNTLVSSSATYTVSNVAAAQTFEARFRPVVHIRVATFKSSGRVTLNGAAGVVGSSAYVVAEADIPQGDSVTIVATSLNPSISPFKAWYLDPSAWGNPEGTGTLVSGAGDTYTFQASADATYFATFTSPVHIEVRTEVGAQSSQEAPAAVVSINGQSAGNNRYELDVLLGSSVTVEASDYGGVVNADLLGDVRLYFEGWRPDWDAIIVSTDLRYTFQAVGMSYRYMGAVYSRYVEVPTVVMPDASTGSISTTPTAKGGSWFEAFTDVTLRAKPSPGYTFIKWTLWKRSNQGRETETFISGDELITIRAGDDYTTLAPTYAYRAYFGRTHLLVNSFNRSTPVQLVYDPATNLLVADY